MSVCAVGSIAFDSIETPFGKRARALGGTAVHFALAASFFTDVHLVGVVGADFGDEEFDLLESRGVDMQDVQRIDDGETFSWSGRYGYDLNVAETLDTKLNVFAEFVPTLSERSRQARMLFLGNIQPQLQRDVRAQCANARFVALDSMNYWIDSARDELLRAISEVDCLLLNDAETRQLTEQSNLAGAARTIRSWGPRIMVAKLGEYGACLFGDQGFFGLPGYPLEEVRDPTGAGDTFAGGFLGYLAACEEEELTDDLLRCAMTYGSVIASFNVEGFGTERVQSLGLEEIEERFADFRRFTRFESIPFVAR